ncbi:MAG: hypothetical protein LWX52_01255 [Deltaproteobacteria bacterium]|nr:hypothetical protein [Deltaproteobacteria bacterium]
MSGQAPCSGAERRDKELDAVSTAIHGGAAAVNGALNRREKAVRLFHVRVQALVSS